MRATGDETVNEVERLLLQGLMKQCQTAKLLGVGKDTVNKTANGRFKIKRRKGIKGMDGTICTEVEPYSCDGSNGRWHDRMRVNTKPCRICETRRKLSKPRKKLKRIVGDGGRW